MKNKAHNHEHCFTNTAVSPLPTQILLVVVKKKKQKKEPVTTKKDRTQAIPDALEATR